jgi:hypothetical protein
VTRSAAPPSRKRSPREDVRRSQAALLIVRPLQHDVGAWQVEIAQLISHAERLRARRQHDPGARQRIAVLEQAIHDARSRLSTELWRAPKEVRDHGRIRDMHRAIDSALAGLEQAQHLLG